MEIRQTTSIIAIPLSSRDVPADLVKKGFDLAIRLGTMANSSLKSRRIANIRWLLVASPKLAMLAAIRIWYLPTREIEGEIASSKLVQVLPEWHHPALVVYLVRTDTGPQMALTRRLIDLFIEHRTDLSL